VPSDKLTLAEFLGTSQPIEEQAPRLEDITDAKAFAEAVLTSREFRSYIVNSLTLGSLPAAVTTRLMDYAWGKPAERIEHTGKNGQPIETITEVRRVLVRVNVEQQQEAEDTAYTTH
jgi:hypothetical protein